MIQSSGSPCKMGTSCSTPMRGGYRSPRRRGRAHQTGAVSRITVTRQVALVRIMYVHGLLVEKASIEEAITFIQDYHEVPSTQPFVRYEVEVLYNNENRINGQFQDKASAVQFLRDYAPPPPGAGT